jgi:Cupin-like domain
MENAIKLVNFVAHGAKAQWSLSRTPHYNEALTIDSIPAGEVSAAEFHKHYVARNRPCRLIGAVKHWPAYQKWTSADYLREKVGDRTVTARTYPASEYIRHVKQPVQARLLEKKAASARTLSFLEFLDSAANQSGQLVIASARFSAGGTLESLYGDMGAFAFLPRLEGSVLYPSHRAFLYRESYTDWHFHPVDEALMTQVVGAKEVLLLPPDQLSWDALWPIACETGYLFDIDLRRFPLAAKLRPYRIVVEAGDALYLPAYWWHAVESVDEKFGVTVTATFKTPPHVRGDWQYPAARFWLKNNFFERLPLVVTALAASTAHRIVQKFK